MMPLKKKDLIFDVGCHTGEDSDFYLKKGFTVVAVEANPHLCAELKENFGDQIAAGRFILVEKAIADEEGEVTFYVNKKLSIWGTINPVWAQRNALYGNAESTEISVPSVRFRSLLQEFGVPYYLKIDIEGADLLCLKDLSEIQDRPQFLSLEITDRRMFPEMMNLLSRLGYVRFQLVDQSRVDQQKVPSPSREGEYVNQRFVRDASGLFGRELPGAWQARWLVTLEFYSMVILKRIFRLPVLNRIKLRHTWHDIHAKLER